MFLCSTFMAWCLFVSRVPCYTFDTSLGNVGFVVDRVALGHVVSEQYGIPYQFTFHRLLHTHHHVSSGAGTIDQIVADAQNGLSLTPPHPKKLKNKIKIIQTELCFIGEPYSRHLDCPQ
jgi:hypothetical protein